MPFSPLMVLGRIPKWFSSKGSIQLSANTAKMAATKYTGGAMMGFSFNTSPSFRSSNSGRAPDRECG